MRSIVAALLLLVAVVPPPLNAQSVRNRIIVAIDTRADMLTTLPRAEVYASTCAAQSWNGCTSSGNPSAAQETCDACMAWTNRVSPGCTTNFSAGCRATYANCARFFMGGTGCPTPTLVQGVLTRGDGSNELPGCDVDGNGLADDSKLRIAKDALALAIAARSDVDFSLWRMRQLQGGQACVTADTCQVTPNNSPFTCVAPPGESQARCLFDAASLGSANGECSAQTWTGSESSFSCAQCSDTGAERLLCEAQSLGAIRTSGTSPLGGTVTCLPVGNSSHRYVDVSGAISAPTCEPIGGEQLTQFAPSGTGSPLGTWIDNAQPVLGTDVELRANRDGSVAGLLRDIRPSVLATLNADTQTSCRRHAVVLVLAQTETCETASTAINAAAALQDLAFTNGAGQAVTGYDVPVHIVALNPCPASTPNCPARIDLDAIAAAGGTTAATVATSPTEVVQALDRVFGDNANDTCTNDLFKDGFE